MSLFEQCFSETAIIRELCKARVKLSKLRHEKQFFHNIRRGQKSPSELKPKTWGSIPRNIFPPRRLWHRFRPAAVKRGDRASVNLNLDALFRATLKMRTEKPSPQWARNLDRVVRRIRRRTLKEKRFSFSKPIITPMEKSPGGHEYRPLVQFWLEDKIIDCLTARYLRESLDSIFEDSCLAFRCGGGAKSAPTIHDALAKLLLVNQQHHRKGRYVAECDIKGFFDCVSHRLVHQALSEIVKEARKNNRLFELDDRVMAIMKAYLRAYAFSRDVNGRGPAKKNLRKKDPQGRYKWPLQDLRRLYGKKRLQRIGVPQGGALSCFIANLVLHKVDCELRRWSGKHLLYMRYCDDMILVADTRKLCKEAFECYRKTLKKLLLPVHPPEKVQRYTKEIKHQFWDHKSNHPYYWAPLREVVFPGSNSSVTRFDMTALSEFDQSP